MPERFQLGDVVCLRSNGREMTVDQPDTAPDGAPIVVCHWFADGRLQQSVFRVDDLDKVETPET